MIKRVLFLLMALLLLCNAGLAGKQDVVDSFKTHVQKIMQPVLATYKENTTHIRYFDPARHGLPGAGHWSKVRYLEPVYSLDVKQNDSVMYPRIQVSLRSSAIQKYLQVSIPLKKRRLRQRSLTPPMRCSTGAFIMAIRMVHGRKQK